MKMAKIGAAFVLGLFVAGPFAAALKLEGQSALEVTSRNSTTILQGLGRYAQRYAQAQKINLKLKRANLTAKGNLSAIPGLSGLLDNLTDTLLQPVQDAVNNSLTELNEKVDKLVPLFVQKKEQLLNIANEGWKEFVAKLNSTIWDSEDLWGQVPWKVVTDTLDSVGASSQVPDELTLALEVLTDATKTISEFEEFGPALLQSKRNEAQEMASNYLQPYLDKLFNLMTVVEVNKEKLKTAFGALITNLDTWIHNVPGHGFIPERVFKNLNTMLQGLQVVVDNVADTAYSAVDEFVKGLQEAVNIVLANEGVAIATGPSGAPRAARLGGILTTATLVLALGFA
jgi:hypothetical protein